MAGEPLPLRFRSDGTFTIVQLTDLHFHNGGEVDDRTRDCAARVLDAERPDLVMYTGDLVSGWENEDPARALKAALAPAAERRLPFAVVYGNHDDEGPLSRHDLLALQRTHPTCLTEVGPTSLPGVGNYVLPVLSAGNGAVAAALHGVDSLAYAPRRDPKTFEGYAWISEEQGAWHRQVVRALEAGRVGRPPLPALAFFHIPLPEYNDVWETRTCRGSKYEDVCCPKVNSGFFAALREAGQVLGTFVGHDHVNDYDGDLDGIRLCYGRGGGFNSYGREGFLRGARVIRLREGVRAFETWCRLEDGSALTDPPVHPPAGKVNSLDA